MEGRVLEKKTKFFRKTVCGYRHTGREVIIEGTTVRMLESSNCYGYLIAHDGPFYDWIDRTVGKGEGSLEAVRGNPHLFNASVQHGRSMELVTAAEARESAPTGGACGSLTAGGGSAAILAFTGVGAWVYRRKRSGQAGSKPEPDNERPS